MMFLLAAAHFQVASIIDLSMADTSPLELRSALVPVVDLLELGLRALPLHTRPLVSLLRVPFHGHL